MKHLILISLALITLNVKANGAELNDIARCKLVDASAEIDLFVTLSNNSEGQTQIRVERVYQADSSVQSYAVKMQDSDPRAVTSSSTFIGNGISLTADFTDELPQGGYKTVLKLQDHDSVTFENLACSPVYHNPQMNYTY